LLIESKKKKGLKLQWKNEQNMIVGKPEKIADFF